MFSIQFEVSNVRLFKDGTAEAVLNPVLGTEFKGTFWDGLPLGRIELKLDNVESAKLFNPGDEFTVEFRRAENDR